VINKIKFLCGKGVPSCNVSGIESAAASEELSSQAQILKNYIKQFKLKDEELSNN